jgi:hypothetical protein
MIRYVYFLFCIFCDKVYYVDSASPITTPPCGSSVSNACKSIVLGCEQLKASTILIKNGEYGETKQFIVTSQLELIGEHRFYTKLKVADNFSITLFLLNTLNSELFLNEIEIEVSRSMFLIYGSSLIFSECFITQHPNIINLYGLCIVSQNVSSEYVNNITIQNCECYNISTTDNATFCFNWTINIEVLNCYFVNISCANNPNNYHMYASGCMNIFDFNVVNICTCAFRLCSTNHFGGGICFYNGSYIFVEKSLFVDCFSQYLGGSLLCGVASAALFDNCSFLHSYGNVNGGAAYVFRVVDFTCVNCTFFNCTSLSVSASSSGGGYGSGGAFYIQLSNSTNISNSSFERCRGIVQGTIYYIIWNSSISENNIHYIINCTFLNNRGGDGPDVCFDDDIPLTSEYVYGCCTDRAGTFATDDGDIILDLLNTSCDSPPAPSPSGECPSPFFLWVDEQSQSSSCLQNCPSGTVGSFGKCYSSCDYSYLHVSTQIFDVCSSSCPLLSQECVCGLFGESHTCESESGCIWVEGDSDVGKFGRCKEIKDGCSAVINDSDLCNTPGSGGVGTNCFWLLGSESDAGICMDKV